MTSQVEQAVDRSYILLRGHQIFLKSSFNMRGVNIHLTPFNDLEEAYEVCWLVDHETAMKIIMETHKQKWREREFKPIHSVSPSFQHTLWRQ